MLSEIAAAAISFSIGSNNTSNAFGIPVGCGILNFRNAVILIGIFVTIGSLTQRKVMETVGSIASLNRNLAVVVLTISALMIVLSNLKKSPVSSHQVIVGSIVGAGVATATAKLGILIPIVVSWILSPIGAVFIAIVVYFLLEKIFSRFSVFLVERILFLMLILSGVLVAYNTGSNELAAALAPLVSAKLMSPVEASLLGSFFLFIGALFMGGRVVETVGKGITALDPLSGFSAQFSAGLTVLFFTNVGMPVSTTYSLIGGIVGVGLLKGVKAVKLSVIRKILITWVLAPLSSFLLTYLAIRFGGALI